MKKIFLIIITGLSLMTCKKNGSNNEPSTQTTTPPTAPTEVSTGKLISQMRTESTNGVSTTNYVYNSRNQLTEAHVTSTSGNGDLYYVYNDNGTLKSETYTSSTLTFINDFVYENGVFTVMNYTKPAATKDNYYVQVKNHGTDLEEATTYNIAGQKGSVATFTYNDKNLTKITYEYNSKTTSTTTYEYSNKTDLNFNPANGQTKAGAYPSFYKNEMLSKTAVDGSGYITKTTYSYLYNSDNYPIKVVATTQNDDRIILDPLTFTVTTTYTYINKK